MTTKSRFNVFMDQEHRFLVIRPIGPIPGAEVGARVLEFYGSVDAPWTFNRIVDLRRHDGYVSNSDLDAIATGWAEMTKGIAYRAHVAMVVKDAYEKLRAPEISSRFPNETICYFSDYHEAVGWIIAVDQSQYLANLGAVPERMRDSGSISVS